MSTNLRFKVAVIIAVGTTLTTIATLYVVRANTVDMSS